MLQKRFILIGIYFVLIACCAFGSTLLSQILIGNKHAGFMWLAKCFLVMCSVIAVTAVFLRRSKQSWQEFGVSLSIRRVGDALSGLAAGIGVALLWTLVVFVNAPFHFELNPELRLWPAIMSVAATLGIGIGEEVGYRSFATREIFAIAGALASLLIPTSIFVFVHVLGGVPLLAGILVVGTSSILYGALMLVTRSLPLVAAFHIGNNLVQDALLRTSDASILVPRFAHSTQSGSADLRIWIGMAFVNLVIAFLVLRGLDTHRLKKIWNTSH